MNNYILSHQEVLFGKPEIVGFGDNLYYVEEISRNVANGIILKNHYSKKFYNNSTIHLGIYMDGGLTGVLQYGFALNPSSGTRIVKNTKNDEYLELNRMWLDDKAPRNSESRAISCSIKYIRGKYKKIKWIQSFADERCGRFGVVYQASNFKYFGEHKAKFLELDGVYYHNICATAKREKAGRAGIIVQNNMDRVKKHTFRQFRYIFFMKPKYMKNCLLSELPYPKS